MNSFSQVMKQCFNIVEVWTHESKICDHYLRSYPNVDEHEEEQYSP